MKKHLVIFYLLSLVYTVLYVGLQIVFDAYTMALADYFTLFYYARQVLTLAFYAGMAAFVIRFAAVPKASPAVEGVLIDLPVLLALTAMFWRRPLFGWIDNEWVRSFLLDDHFLRTAFIWGSLLLGMELVRFMRRRKAKPEKKE